MRLVLRRKFPFPADVVWRAILNPKVMVMCAAPKIEFSGFQWDSQFQQNKVYSGSVSSQGMPTIDYSITFTRIDHEATTWQSKESGGYIRKWNHERKVKKIDPHSCWLEDSLDIDAGNKTLLMWLFSFFIYRKRNQRLFEILRDGVEDT